MGTTSNQVLLVSMTSIWGSCKTTEEEKPLEKALCKRRSDEFPLADFTLCPSYNKLILLLLFSYSWVCMMSEGDIPYMFITGPTHLDSVLLSAMGSQSEDSQLKGMETRARTISDRGTASRPRIRHKDYFEISVMQSFSIRGQYHQRWAGNEHNRIFSLVQLWVCFEDRFLQLLDSIDFSLLFWTPLEKSSLHKHVRFIIVHLSLRNMKFSNCFLRQQFCCVKKL